MTLLSKDKISNPLLFGGVAKKTSGDWRIFTFGVNGDLIDTQWVDDGTDGIEPIAPTVADHTFYGYNGSYTNVTEDRFIGAIYNTTGGESRITFRASTNTGLQPQIYLNKSTSATLTVNWGDGNSQTTTATGNTSITKTAAYASEGDYTITVTCSGTYTFGNATNTTQIFGNTNYMLGIISMSLGANITNLSSYMLQGAKSMCCFSTGSGITAYTGTGGNIFNACYALKCLNFPSGLNTAITGIFANCFSIRAITYNSLTSIASSAFINCYNLYYFSIPNVVLSGTEYNSNYAKRSFVFGTNVTNVPANAFNSNFAALEYVFPKSDTIVTLANINALTNVNANCKIYVADSLVSTYKAATNWITYANQIYTLSVRPNYPVML